MVKGGACGQGRWEWSSKNGEKYRDGVPDWRVTTGCHVLAPWGPHLRGHLRGCSQSSIHEMDGGGLCSADKAWRGSGKAGDHPGVINCLLSQFSGLTNSRIIELPNAEGERILPFPQHTPITQFPICLLPAKRRLGSLEQIMFDFKKWDTLTYLAP